MARTGLLKPDDYADQSKGAFISAMDEDLVTHETRALVSAAKGVANAILALAAVLKEKK
ncbi:MAG: hypothetical protein PHT40_01090 [Patescibacteria group bacterium]|nr:hypothetical protein [Patescibacteria group bacterium]